MKKKKKVVRSVRITRLSETLGRLPIDFNQYDNLPASRTTELHDLTISIIQLPKSAYKVIYFLTQHKISYLSELSKAFIIRNSTLEYAILKLKDLKIIREIKAAEKNPRTSALLLSFKRTGYNAPREHIKFYELQHQFKPNPSFYERYLTATEIKRVKKFKRWSELKIERRRRIRRKVQKKAAGKLAAEQKAKRKYREAWKKLELEIVTKICKRDLSNAASVKLIKSYMKKDAPIFKLKTLEKKISDYAKRGVWENWKQQQRIKFGL